MEATKILKAIKTDKRLVMTAGKVYDVFCNGGQNSIDFCNAEI